jgi:hypothetical protein
VTQTLATKPSPFFSRICRIVASSAANPARLGTGLGPKGRNKQIAARVIETRYL